MRPADWRRILLCVRVLHLVVCVLALHMCVKVLLLVMCVLALRMLFVPLLLRCSRSVQLLHMLLLSMLCVLLRLLAPWKRLNRLLRVLSSCCTST